jgi:hypothetical protein
MTYTYRFKWRYLGQHSVQLSGPAYLLLEVSYEVYLALDNYCLNYFLGQLVFFKIDFTISYMMFNILLHDFY